ncbi:MAG: FAD-dependent oxidoreductase [Vulcanimicrobiaceae bacterium]
MLGYLLARIGVDVTVLEKHADFLRDFRGDTIHPSTLDILYELDLLDAFLATVPHQELPAISVQIGTTTLRVADFTHLQTHCKFLAFAPQWEFLDFLARAAERYPSFHLVMNARVEALHRRGDRVVGVRAHVPSGTLDVWADLVVGADGRTSAVRSFAGLEVIDFGAPIDVLWLRLSRRRDDPAGSFGRVDDGRIVGLIDRGTYWQCAFVIRKGALEELQRDGFDAFRDRLAALVPLFAERVHELAGWGDVKLLTVRVDRLRRWYGDGVLCIGDAAHAMSPIGGVGINLAIADAVATANRIGHLLRCGLVTSDDLAAVQRRREWPTRVVQRAQVAIHHRFFSRVFARAGPMRPPALLALVARFPILARLPALAIGVGVRPEHVLI